MQGAGDLAAGFLGAMSPHLDRAAAVLSEVRYLLAQRCSFLLFPPDLARMTCYCF
jgi:hypothetical protein